MVLVFLVIVVVWAVYRVREKRTGTRYTARPGGCRRAVNRLAFVLLLLVLAYFATVLWAAAAGRF